MAEAETSGAPPAVTAEAAPTAILYEEPEIIVASSPMPRLLGYPIVPTNMLPILVIHDDQLDLHMHGRLMSVEVGDWPSLSLLVTEPDTIGKCSVMLCVEHAAVYNNVYERRMRPEVDSALSRHFTESLGRTSSRLGLSLSLAAFPPRRSTRSQRPATTG